MTSEMRQMAERIEQVERDLSRSPVRWPSPSPASVETDGGSTPCGCCDCTDCITPAEAVIDDCDDCPNGASNSYTINIGAFTAFPDVGGEKTVTYSASCVWYSSSFAVATAAWIRSTFYIVGDYCTNDTGKTYVCVTAGLSASSGGPTGTGSAIADGGASWDYVAP
jgi:hypothetical protein